MNTSFEFTGLMPGKSYTATIVSVSGIGIGFPSISTFYIPTEQDATLSGMYVSNRVHANVHTPYVYVRTCIHMYVHVLLGF